MLHAELCTTGVEYAVLSLIMPVAGYTAPVGDSVIVPQ